MNIAAMIVDGLFLTPMQRNVFVKVKENLNMAVFIKPCRCTALEYSDFGNGAGGYIHRSPHERRCRVGAVQPASFMKSIQVIGTQHACGA